jgi:hypothetical protein
VSAFRAFLGGGALLLTACAPTLTPQQEWVMSNFDSCRRETGGWNAVLDRVDADGRMSVSAAQTQSDVNRVIACMRERQQREGEHQPPQPPSRVTPRPSG